MRPGERPLAELGLALPVARAGRAGAEPVAARSTRCADERLVLAVDQFEEIFTACRDEAERAAFVDALVAFAATPTSALWWCSRSGPTSTAAAPSTRALAAMSANHVLVGPMRRDELRRAIEFPPAGRGCGSSRRWSRRWSATSRTSPAGCRCSRRPCSSSGRSATAARCAMQAYERERRRQRRGGPARRARLRRLSPAQRERARAILLRLADAEQAVRVRSARPPQSELEPERDRAPPPSRCSPRAAWSRSTRATVEVAHEALLRGVAAPARLARGGRRGPPPAPAPDPRGGRVARSGRDPAELYRGARLASALDWAAGHDPELNDLERGFLDVSTEAKQYLLRHPLHLLRTDSPVALAVEAECPWLTWPASCIQNPAPWNISRSRCRSMPAWAAIADELTVQQPPRAITPGCSVDSR